MSRRRSARPERCRGVGFKTGDDIGRIPSFEAAASYEPKRADPIYFSLLFLDPRNDGFIGSPRANSRERAAGEVRLTKRPEWVRPAIASPRHWFSWFVWSSEPRPPSQDPFLRFAGHGSGRCGG
jgi:hypothetical protein